MKNDNIPTCTTSQDEPVQSYYLKLGKETIHGLSLEDLKSLYETIEDYWDREDEIPMANENSSSDLGQYSMIRKTTTFNKGIFSAGYTADALYVEIQSTPSWVILDLFLTLLSFLNQVEKMDIQCSIPGVKPKKIKSTRSRKNKLDVLLQEENDTHKKIDITRETPMIIKNETLTRINEIPKIEYDVQINDQGLSYLSRDQVMEIQSVIERFLKQKTL
ncbi:hypothetical protein DWW18_00375 [Butyricimonas virosa]|jgi:hypothetical protein|uniref:Uncharacterized protein n=1 Tax=Butyricimonas virosa TaxID=544645 RepID=A0A412X771_9BACT|nr:hypothetical protein [Butyricimonas virosa]MBQ6791853.1 hypothetical protein [Butyricimonas sp.]MBS5624467.1 hypothetical protein [Porphyromonadaceae bacterium]MBR5463630.1 hypothetical protein [Butyricimonas sp.]MCI7389352.1 hypothetical protein [Butyricimonas virosa]MDY4905827.1 hypothetical protein [Butyricimonas virosa]